MLKDFVGVIESYSSGAQVNGVPNNLIFTLIDSNGESYDFLMGNFSTLNNSSYAFIQLLSLSLNYCFEVCVKAEQDVSENYHTSYSISIDTNESDYINQNIKLGGNITRDYSYSYKMVGSSLYPFFIMSRTLVNCELQMPTDPSYGEYLYYFKQLEKYLSSLRSVWEGNKKNSKPSMLLKMLSEHDRRLNRVWRNYDSAVKKYLEILPTFVIKARESKKNRYVISFPEGVFLLNNTDKIKELALQEKKQADLLYEEAKNSINNLFNDAYDEFSHSVSIIDKALDDFCYYNGGKEKYSQFELELARIKEAQQLKLNNITNLDWTTFIRKSGPTIAILTISATIGFLLFPPAGGLPFLSGLTVTLWSGLTNIPDGYFKEKSDLEKFNQEYNDKVIQKSNISKDWAVYSCLSSFVYSGRKVLQSLKSAPVAIEQFKNENDVKYDKLISVLDELDKFCKIKRRLSKNDIERVATLNISLTSAWNYALINKYMTYDSAKENDLYCFHVDNTFSSTL